MTAPTEETPYQRRDREHRELMLRLIVDGAAPHMRVGHVVSPTEALDVVNIAARSASALIDALWKWETGQ